MKSCWSQQNYLDYFNDSPHLGQVQVINMVILQISYPPEEKWDAVAKN